MEIHQPKDCIILFMRAPEVGKVKTRLSEKLKPEIVLDLYQNFVLDILNTAQKTKIDLRIFFYPTESEAMISQWLGDQYDYRPQQGSDLGIQMKNAFIQTFASGYERAILIGTDCPEMTEDILKEAFHGIRHAGCVIGPSIDGGYYLIGFEANAFTEKPFQEVTWGTDIVLQQTIKRCLQMGIKPHILPRLNDIDTLDDLILFRRHCSNNNFFESHTMQCMIKHKIKDEAETQL